MADVASHMKSLIGNADVFPVLREWTHLNHAGMSALPAPAAREMQQYAEHSSKHAYLGTTWFADLDKMRQLAADVINADASEIALVKNTGEGISIAAGGMSWSAGDVVVTTAVEYPSNLYPWMEVAHTKGITIVCVPEVEMPGGSRHVPMADILAAAADPRCKLVTLSHVQYASGQRHDLAVIGKFCRDNGKYFCVDAIQSIGALPVDVKAMHIDFLAAGSHKWMMGPPGAGFFYCRKELTERLRPVSVGWANVVDAMNFSDINYTLRPDAGRFECGSPNLAGIVALRESLGLLHSVGMANIYQRIQVLLDRAVAGIVKKGYAITSPRDEASRSGILIFSSPVHSHAEICKQLQAKKIEMIVREGRLRISPQFYNTEAQIDRLIEELPGH